MIRECQKFYGSNNDHALTAQTADYCMLNKYFICVVAWIYDSFTRINLALKIYSKDSSSRDIWCIDVTLCENLTYYDLKEQVLK